MIFSFYIAHKTAGRTRIRWVGESAKKNQVIGIAVDISKVEGVDQAKPRINTGSIIIEHDEIDWSQLEPLLTNQLPLIFTSAPPRQQRTGLEQFNQGIDKVDRALKEMDMDLNSLTVLLLSIMALVQAARGQVMVSSASFLWYAFSVASRSRGNDNTPLDS